MILCKITVRKSESFEFREAQTNVIHKRKISQSEAYAETNRPMRGSHLQNALASLNDMWTTG